MHTLAYVHLFFFGEAVVNVVTEKGFTFSNSFNCFKASY